MKIQILGTGCAKCEMLEAHARQAVNEMGLDAEIVKIDRPMEIARMGVLMTPALAVDGEVRSAGHLLSVGQIRKILE